MDFLQPKQDLNDIKLGHFLTHEPKLFDQGEEFPSRTKLEHEDKTIFGLEGKFHFDEKRMVELCHDISFIHNNFLLLISDNKSLVNYFHSIEMAILFETTQIHFRKAA